MGNWYILQRKRVMGKLVQFKYSQEKKQAIRQFVKFGLVGVSNTAISYVTEMLIFYILLRDMMWSNNLKIFVSSLSAFVVSVTNSYYWNARYVFTSKKKKTLKGCAAQYGKTFICYGVTGLVLSPILKIILRYFEVPYWIASLVALMVSVPLNFAMNKLWAFKQ